MTKISLLSLLLSTSTLFLSACSRPLADSIALSGQETQRALVGYDDTTYVYPVRVPGSAQTVRIVTDKPLSYQPDYDDFLTWHASGKLPDKGSVVGSSAK